MLLSPILIHFNLEHIYTVTSKIGTMFAFFSNKLKNLNIKKKLEIGINITNITDITLSNKKIMK